MVKEMILHIKEYLLFHKQNFEAKKRKKNIANSLSAANYEHLKITLDCNSKWYGSAYGGFYIHPNILNEHSVVYSFGIGKDISFDKRCIKNHNCNVYGFDPTPKSINWLNSIKIPKKFHPYPFGISTVSGKQYFYLPKNKGTSGSIIENDSLGLTEKTEVEMKSLEDCCKLLGHSTIDVLKIDIEGAEYEVLPSILDSKINVKQILLEIHDRQFDANDPPSKELVKKLKANGYELFAVSEIYEELSFIHKSLLN